MIFGAGLAALAAGHAAYGHGDVMVYESGGKIITGVIEADLGEPEEAVSVVFEGELADNGLAVAGDEPGYANVGAHSFKLPAGTELGFNVRNNIYTSTRLAYWDGSDTDSDLDIDVDDVVWSSVPASFDVTIQSQLSSDFITFDGSTSGALSGFLIETADASGELHEHLDYFLPLNAPAGIYLLTLELTDLRASNPLTGSDPISLVLNFGVDEEAHEAAVSAVPEPASAVSLLLAGGALLRRRR